MKIDNFLQSKLLKGVIIGVGIFAVLTLVFSLGVFVGLEKAEYSFRWADQYHRNFGGPQGGFLGDFMGANRDFANANGSFGQIINIDAPSKILTVKDVSNVENNILVGDKTIIIYQRKNIKISDLKVDENVVIIGEPDNYGQIQAKLIRVMPPILKDSLPSNLNPQ